MDGVIVDSHPVHKKAWGHLLRSLGKNPTEDDLQFVVDGRRRDEILEHFLGSLSEEQIAEYGARKSELYERFAHELRLTSGLLEFLQALEACGIAIAVATSARRARAENTLHRFGIRRFFSAIVTGEDIERGKPDPQVFLAACDALKVLPGEAVVFEDAGAGVQGARAAGIHCIGLGEGDHARLLRKHGAYSVVPDFQDPSIRGIIPELFPSDGPSLNAPENVPPE